MSSETEKASTPLLMRPLNWLETKPDAVFAYVLLAPAFLLLAVVAFFPLVRTFQFSLRADAIRSAEPFGEFIGFGHYQDLLTGNASLPQQFVDLSMETPILQQALFVTLGFAIISVLFETLIGFGQALILDQEFRGRRWVRVAIIIPYAIPIVIQAMIFYLIFSPRIGFGTEFLNSIGVFGSNPLQNTTDSFFIVLVADVWKTSAFMALLILAGLQSIDRQLYDVAKVTGASPWQRFKYITMPLIASPLLVAMLFRTMDAMRIYGLIDATAGCQTVPSMSCLVITALNQTRRWGSASAVAFLTAITIGLVVIVYLIGLRDSEAGMT
nr:sugar ABC transporter permease [Halapricum desulfuricans]